MTVGNNFLHTKGRRKTSVSLIKATLGKGNLLLNGEKVDQNNKYFEIVQPFLSLLEDVGYDLQICLRGGGVVGQETALRLAILRMLDKLDLKTSLVVRSFYSLGYDDRIKERRKYGLKKARKGSQYSKR
jgi:small subunit ribosomal protein S9